MKILFVWSAAEWSIMDVAAGYRKALESMGHEIRDYRLYNRMKYHAAAMGSPLNDNRSLLSRQSSENAVIEAMYMRADLVVIASGFFFHPNALWLLKQIDMPTVTVFTESPYDDEKQKLYADTYPSMICATNDRFSAEKYGWLHLAPAFDPEIHKPVEPDTEFECDVFMTATGWRDRQELLEAVDWVGIKLLLYGTWPEVKEDSPLMPFLKKGNLDNEYLPAAYAAAKICLNHHRSHPDALSWNPRAMEIAACGVFQLTDYRSDLSKLMGGTLAVYRDSDQLESTIRYWLQRPPLRRVEAAAAVRDRVRGETFYNRSVALLNESARRLNTPVPAEVGGLFGYDPRCKLGCVPAGIRRGG